MSTRPTVREKRVLLAIGANLKTARLRQKLTLARLSALSGVSKGNCCKMEKGANATVLSYYRISEVLQVNIHDILPI